MDSFCRDSNLGCAIFLSVIIEHNVDRLFSVVLDTASDYAGFAPGAPIEIDHHRPLRFF